MQTDIDSDSPAPVSDSLLQPFDEEPPPSSESSFDSQLTANEDPNDPPGTLLVSLPPDPIPDGQQPHWADKAFYDCVDFKLHYVRTASWCETWVLDQQNLTNMPRCLNMACHYIRDNMWKWDKFKIGVCECPMLRWNDKSIGLSLIHI